MFKTLKVSLTTLLMATPFANADVFYPADPSGMTGVSFVACNTCEAPHDFIRFAEDRAKKAYSRVGVANNNFGASNSLQIGSDLNLGLLNPVTTYVVVNSGTEVFKTIKVTRGRLPGRFLTYFTGQIITNSVKTQAQFIDYQSEKTEFANNLYYSYDYQLHSPINLVANVIDYGEIAESWRGTASLETLLWSRLKDLSLSGEFNPFKFVESPLAVQVTTSDGYTVLLVKMSTSPYSSWRVVYASYEWWLLDESDNQLHRTAEFNPAMTCFSTPQREVCRHLSYGFPVGNVFVRAVANDPLRGPEPEEPRPPVGCSPGSSSCTLD